MKINKYLKVGNHTYKVFLENGNTILLQEDVILKFDLLLKKEIENLEEIQNYNVKYTLYTKTLNYISKRQRTEKEIRVYLEKYTNDLEYIDKVLEKLKEMNMLNSKVYIRSYINDKIHFGFDGPEKIRKNLLELDFLEEEINEELEIFDQTVREEKIRKYIEKQLKGNKKSLYVFKNKMVLALLNLGYSRSEVLRELDKINFSDDILKEREEEKLRQKYSKKYSGYQLEQIIKRKLYEKGYRS